jgi:hypothetical protein
MRRVFYPSTLVTPKESAHALLGTLRAYRLPLRIIAPPFV